LPITWQSDAEPRPALLVLPPAAASLDEAHAAIELWEHYSCKTLDPTQKLAVEVMMAQRSDERWAAATTGREMPRQNGKGDEVEVVELWGLVQRAETILHTIHDAVLLATQTQERMAGVLEGHADLRRRVKRKWTGTGQQMIEMHNGGIIWYRTRTGSGGRGVDYIDRLVVDEAQHAVSEQLAAVSPTLLANPNPQTNAMGTAGLAGKSAWWWRIRRRALTDDPGSFGYVGHTAEKLSLLPDGSVHQEPVDPSDRSLWPASNPSIVNGRGSGMEFFEEEFQNLGADDFGREHLCIWDPEPGTGGADAIPAAQWELCRDPTAERGPVATYAIEVDADNTAATIAASDGRFGAVVEWNRGSKWLPATLKKILVDKPGAVWLDPNGPAGSLLSDLRDMGIEWNEITARQHAQACGELYAAVVEDQSFRHHGQPVLDIARKQATRKPYGDAWAWERRKPDQSVSPIAAVTIARWAALQAEHDYVGPLVATT
jgi:hypothetical protein